MVNPFGLNFKKEKSGILWDKNLEVENLLL